MIKFNRLDSDRCQGSVTQDTYQSCRTCSLYIMRSSLILILACAGQPLSQVNWAPIVGISSNLQFCIPCLRSEQDSWEGSLLPFFSWAPRTELKLPKKIQDPAVAAATSCRSFHKALVLVTCMLAYTADTVMGRPICRQLKVTCWSATTLKENEEGYFSSSHILGSKLPVLFTASKW